MKETCKNCAKVFWASQQETVCSLCVMGNESPSLWISRKLKSEIEALSKRYEAKYSKPKFLSAHETLYFEVSTGKCLGQSKPHDMATKDHISIAASVSCDNNEERSNPRLQIYKWIDGGFTSIEGSRHSISSYDNIVVEVAPLLLIAVCETLAYVKEDRYHCAGCKDDYKNPPAGRHFAGTYCKPCWEKFKLQNSRVCRRCRRPGYECCC